jgi:hypothetical protein
MLHVVKGYRRCCHGNYRAHMRIPDVTLHVQLGCKRKDGRHSQHIVLLLQSCSEECQEVQFPILGTG